MNHHPHTSSDEPASSPSVDNRTADRSTKRQTRYAQLTLLVLLFAIPLVIYGAIMALRSTSNDPRQWLPRSFAATDTYDWFQEHFGSDEIAVVSWPGCTLDDPRVPQLANAIESSPFFDRVLTGESVMRQLMAPPLEFSRDSVKRRLQGTLIQPDGDTTCLIVSTSAHGRANRVEAIAKIKNLALSTCEIPSSELRLAGPTVDAAAIDIESRRLRFCITQAAI